MKGYRSAFTKDQLLFDGDTPCNAGQYTKIGEYQIVAGELVKLGYLQGDQAGAEGRVHMELKKADGTVLNGTIRIVALSPQDMPLSPPILFEARTEALNQSATDRTKQIPFNDMGIALSEDKKYATMFKPDGNEAVSVNKDKSTILMDITRVLLK